jgi:hypothetical protein
MYQMFLSRLLVGLALVFACDGPCSRAFGTDWLVDPKPFTATISQASGGNQVELSNGLVRRVIQLRPNAATVALNNVTTAESLLRSVRPEARVTLNGRAFDIGGLLGQPIHNYLDPKWLDQLTANPDAFQFLGVRIGKTAPRFAWQKRHEWLTSDPAWPPPGASVTLSFVAPGNGPAVQVDVHYEIYDGVPLVSKWLSIRNDSSRPITLDSVMVEQLAVVEPESIVDGGITNFRTTYRNLEVLSDYSFGGNMSENADAPAVHWKSDPLYPTQVHYERQTPCLLECSPSVGPDAEILPGQTFESFHVFELVHDGSDRERRGLAVRRVYRTLAPWVQENPILMHVRSAKPDAVKLAIDQCAEVGFELVILTFGSGFDIENEKPQYLAEVKSLAEYARAKGIVLGGYSLLASRSINPENDAINPKTGKPGGARFDNSPCLCSAWGEDYFRKLYQFFDLGKDPEHGLDVRAPNRVSGRRSGRDD